MPDSDLELKGISFRFSYRDPHTHWQLEALMLPATTISNTVKRKLSWKERYNTGKRNGTHLHLNPNLPLRRSQAFSAHQLSVE